MFLILVPLGFSPTGWWNWSNGPFFSSFSEQNTERRNSNIMIYFCELVIDVLQVLTFWSLSVNLLRIKAKIIMVSTFQTVIARVHLEDILRTKNQNLITLNVNFWTDFCNDALCPNGLTNKDRFIMKFVIGYHMAFIIERTSNPTVFLFALLR